MAQINCQNLKLGYDNQTVVEGVSFLVNAGDYLCVLGENGSGKTTLMKTMLGLTAPLDGELSFGDGLKLSDIGYMPQQTQIQRDFPAHVDEIVLSGLQGRIKYSPFYTKSDKEDACEIMNRLGIYNLRKKSYRNLSGGQQQRVLLARALLATTKCLLLDEPISGLDAKACEDMYEIINELNNSGITIIMISHDTDAALKYADYILHIGDDVFFGTRNEYMDGNF